MLQKTSRQDKFRLSLELGFKGKEQASLIAKAVRPELNARHAKRSATTIGIKKTRLAITIKAQDIVALRAALNSCLNSVIVAKEAMEV